MSNEKTVAFIGLGAMGWGIAANLAAAAARGAGRSPAPGPGRIPDTTGGENASRVIELLIKLIKLRGW